MKCILSFILAISASVLYAQSARTALFRATLLSANEAPGGTWDASGVVDVLVHAVSDTSGNIVSGSVDLSLTYQLPNDKTITGLGIVSAPAGTIGAIPIAADITSATPFHASAGTGRIFRQAQVLASDQGGLAAINGIISNPAGYSVNLFTADHPAGIMSGTLQSAASKVIMARLASSNASGAASVRLMYSGVPYAITSAEVSMQLAYQFPGKVTLASMRIYDRSGKPAIPGAVLPGTQSATSGSGMLTVPSGEIDMSNRAMVEAVQGLLASPGNFTIKVGTVEYPTATLSGQLRGTDSMSFPMANVAGTGAASNIELHTLRDTSGGVQAGTVIFDVNYRLPAGAVINAADVDGSIPNPPIGLSASGSGNIFAAATVMGGDTLNDMVRNPENHTLELQTSGGTGPIRAQLAPANTAAPVVLAVIPIVEDKTLNTFAPGELVEIYGTNLAKVTTDLSGWSGSSLPRSLNGVAVAVGGQFGRILYVSPTQVDAELPFEAPTGTQELSLNNGNAPSAPISINVAPVAPAIYGAVFENADFSLVGPANPAKAGDVVVLYATGLGQTTPVLTTGQVAPGDPLFNTVPVSVTIGGKAVPKVWYSIAAPFYVAGLCQIAVTVPEGVGPGSAPVVVSAGSLASNAVSILVQ